MTRVFTFCLLALHWGHSSCAPVPQAAEPTPAAVNRGGGVYAISMSAHVVYISCSCRAFESEQDKDASREALDDIAAALRSDETLVVVLKSACTGTSDEQSRSRISGATYYLRVMGIEPGRIRIEANAPEVSH